MRKSFLFIIFILTCFFLNPACADSWDDLSNVESLWDGQKSITNQEFEQVMDKLEEKGKQKEEKIKKKKIRKKIGSGTTLHEELNPDNKINELESLDAKEDLVLNVPVDLYIEGKVVEKGYYKILSEVDSKTNKKYLCFYQSQFFKGKVEVVETEDDFEEQELNFVRLLFHDESFVKIIFGSLAFNAYGYVPIVK